MRQDLIKTLECKEAELATLHAIPEDDMTAEQLAQYQSLDRQIISLHKSIDQGE